MNKKYDDAIYRMGILIEASRQRRDREMARSIRDREIIGNLDRIIAGLNRKLKEVV